MQINSFEYSLPDSDYAQSPVHLSFARHVKTSVKEPDSAHTLDPSVRTKSRGADWDRPVWTPLPKKDDSVDLFCRTLSDGWKFCESPGTSYWLNETIPDHTWNDVPVPAELMALGYDIKRDHEYVYKKELAIPSEWNNRTILLKFGMVYEYAKIWIDGHLINGYTASVQIRLSANDEYDLY